MLFTLSSSLSLSLSLSLSPSSISPASAMNEALYKTVMDELAVLISDGDLHISQLVLTLLGTVMNISPSSIREVSPIPVPVHVSFQFPLSQIHEAILPNIHSLVLSSLLQGSAMTACLSFFAKLVTLQLPGLGFDEIFAVRLCVFFCYRGA